jgi:hypothetical protein
MKSRCGNSGWYHHVWCILYTNNWSMVCEIPESISVACSPMFTSELRKGGVVTAPVSLTIAEASSGEAVSIGTLVDKLIPSTQMWLFVCFKLCYWSFSRASRGCASLLCQWVLLHGRLTLMWHSVSVKMTSHLGSKVLYPHQLFLVPTHVVFVTITILVLIVSSRGMKAVLVLVLDHHGFSRSCVKWWCFCELKGHGSAFSPSQTVRYLQTPLTLAKKAPF